MAKVKQIINCETNKKFIKVYGNGFIDIPDVIYHVLTDDGMLHVWGDILHGDVPQIGKELPQDGGSLSSWIDGEKLNKLLAYFQNEEGEEEWTAKKDVDHFFVEMKRKLPYIGIEKTNSPDIRKRVKQIISCETNKKFILDYDDGGLIVPDVNYYVLMEDGRVVVYPEMVNGDPPIIGEELPEDRYRCRVESYISYSRVKRYIITQQDESLSGGELNSRIYGIMTEIKQQLPNIGSFIV